MLIQSSRAGSASLLAMEKPVATPPRKSLRDFRFPTANGGYGYPLGQRSYRPRPFDSYCAALANKGWDVKKNSLAALALEFFLLTSPFIEPWLFFLSFPKGNLLLVCRARLLLWDALPSLPEDLMSLFIRKRSRGICGCSFVHREASLPRVK